MIANTPAGSSAGLTRLSTLTEAPTTGSTRSTYCSHCTTEFEQTFYVGLWTPECPRCTARDDARAEGARAAEEASAAVKRSAMLAALAVPRQYAGASLETFELHGDEASRARQSRNLQLARRYLAMWPDRYGAELDFFPWVAIFRGAPGTGKGHLAWSIAREVASTFGEHAHFVTLADLILDLRERWGGGKDGPTERQRLQRYRSYDLLVIDDASRHALYGAPQQHLFQVIEQREADYMPTIITTNEDANGLAELIGPALESRAAAWAGPIDFGTADYRLHRAQQRRTKGGR